MYEPGQLDDVNRKVIEHLRLAMASHNEERAHRIHDVLDHLETVIEALLTVEVRYGSDPIWALRAPPSL